MGFSAAVAAAVVIGGSMAYSAKETKKARKAEEEQTEVERQRLEATQRQIAAESVASPMPDPKNQARARRRSIAEQMKRRGRASTMLTGNGTTSDPLG